MILQQHEIYSVSRMGNCKLQVVYARPSLHAELCTYANILYLLAVSCKDLGTYGDSGPHMHTIFM